MKFIEALSKSFTIRQLFSGVFAFFLVLLVGNYLAIRNYNIKTSALSQHHNVLRLYFHLQDLSPEALSEGSSDEHFRQLLVEAEELLTFLHEGGEAPFVETTVSVDPVGGALALPVERIYERWPSYRSEYIAEVSIRQDNVARNYSLPITTELDTKYLRIMEFAEELQQASSYALAEKRDQLPYLITILSLLALGCIIALIILLRQIVVLPLNKMAVVTEQLAKGKLEGQIDAEGKNEISEIGRQINNLANLLDNALRFTKSIGEGKLNAAYQDAKEDNRLAQSLLEMQRQMQVAADEDAQRNWTSNGLAKFAEVLRLESEDLDKLSYHAISELVQYVGAQQGSIFIAEIDPKEGTILRQAATFAYDKQKFLKKILKPGEGIIGQTYLEQNRTYLLDIPKGYLEISAGLGQMPPKSLLVVPLIYNEEIQGVAEIASLEEIPPYKVAFIEALGESIAANIATVKSNERTRNLLKKSQEITEKMRSQEDEMRQNMEEMQATYQEMTQVQQETERKEANLNALINNTEDSIATIDLNYNVMIINEILRKRYQGTQYEGIDVGYNILDTLGAVREEWKANYDRVFVGEKLDFTIRSSVNNEDSFRRYTLNPVKDQNGDIIGCSVFSRDVTETKLAELQNKKLISDLTQKNKLFEAAFFFIEVGADKRIQTINELAAIELGYTKEELIGRDINDLFISRDTLTEGISSMMKGEIWKEDVALMSREGSRIRAKSVSTCVVDAETERLVKFILVFYRH